MKLYTCATRSVSGKAQIVSAFGMLAAACCSFAVGTCILHANHLATS